MPSPFSYVEVDVALADFGVNQSSSVVWSRVRSIRVGDIVVECDGVAYDECENRDRVARVRVARLANWARALHAANVLRTRLRLRGFAPYERL